MSKTWVWPYLSNKFGPNRPELRRLSMIKDWLWSTWVQSCLPINDKGLSVVYMGVVYMGAILFAFFFNWSMQVVHFEPSEWMAQREDLR